MEKIGTDNGIEAARRRENEYHPGLTTWDKRSHTLQLLVGNINALIDEKPKQDAAIHALRSRVSVLEGQTTAPFPFK